MRPPRIAIFAHSTNPRGGVVHAMQLAETLQEQGADATLLAPAAPGQSFFRAPGCQVVLIPAAPPPGDVERLVALRRREVACFLRRPGAPRFDILHAQDSISALALSDLAAEGRITGFLRTVHHLDDFTNPLLAAWQDRSVRSATSLFCVSLTWRSELRRRFGRRATLVGGGVDTRRFTSRPEARDRMLRDRWLPDGGRLILALGGIEARKNTLGMLRGFLELAADPGCRDVHLLIAGGASLLDHAAARDSFAASLQGSPHAGRVLLAGVIDDAEMASLYRCAAMLCFASLLEGFGLCVLEAMASGIPAVVSTGAPFDEYLEEGDAIRVDPASSGDIAAGMRRALGPDAIREAASTGPRRAARFDWRRVADAHRADYARFQQESSLHA